MLLDNLRRHWRQWSHGSYLLFGLTPKLTDLVDEYFYNLRVEYFLRCLNFDLKFVFNHIKLVFLGFVKRVIDLLQSKHVTHYKLVNVLCLGVVV
jgi:hypothetical protein